MPEAREETNYNRAITPILCNNIACTKPTQGLAASGQEDSVDVSEAVCYNARMSQEKPDYFDLYDYLRNRPRHFQFGLRRLLLAMVCFSVAFSGGCGSCLR